MSAGSGQRGAAPGSWLFLATVLVGSFLLFLMQPMVARMALPRLGGAPAVWNSAMLVYQALLLAGYFYAHVLGLASPRRQWISHVALFVLAAAWLPIGLGTAAPPPDASPVLWVPWLLIVSIGPLFFMIAAQAPLMQRWFALQAPGADPYRLYIASNFGSFAGLLAYPLLIEPRLTLAQQSIGWTIGYAILVGLVILCGRRLPTATARTVARPTSPRPAGRTWAQWILLAAIPSGLVLSTTTHLTTDIVAMPLIWVIPLGLYLLSFTIAFAGPNRAVRAIAWLFPIFLIAAAAITMTGETYSILLASGIDLGLLFTASVAIHAELYRTRPAVDRLTGFYLALALGGVIGGIVCALFAPVAFDWVYEHPLLIVAAALCMRRKPLAPFVARLWNDPRRGRPLRLIIAVAILALAMAASHLIVTLPPGVVIACAVALELIAAFAAGERLLFTAAIVALLMVRGGADMLRSSTDGNMRTRSFFGVYSVIDRGDRTELVHGTTLHGVQLTTPGKETVRTSYYAPLSGVGIALSAAPKLFGPHARIGVVGLGSGTLSCYRQPGQDWRIYEIDPAMARIARTRFSFLSRCAPDARIVIGDARLSLLQQPAGSHDLLAIDAFSSDAVPMHLLTLEAFAVYRRALSPDGLLLVHISNRFLDLEPVVAAAAKAQGWSATIIDYAPSEAEKTDNGATRSIWIAMTRDMDMIGRMIDNGPPGVTVWGDPTPRQGFAPWTDDHASVLPILRRIN